MPADRQSQILERVRRDGRVRAIDLARHFDTSEDTIRRDLRDLAAQGFCQRVYGGALAISPASGPSHERRQEAIGRKQALAVVAAALVRRGQLIFMDAGSTNLAIARVMPEDLDLTVATHDPAIATALVGRPGVDVVLVGGRVDPVVGAAVNGQAIRTAAALRPDLLFLGVCALEAEAGLAAFNVDDAEMKRVLIQSAGTVAVAVLNEKLGAGAPYLVGPLGVVADLVVEADAPDDVVAALAACGPRLHRAAKGAGC